MPVVPPRPSHARSRAAAVVALASQLLGCWPLCAKGDMGGCKASPSAAEEESHRAFLSCAHGSMSACVQRCAEGDVPSCVRLANAYELGSHGAPFDLARSLELREDLCARGDRRSCEEAERMRRMQRDGVHALCREAEVAEGACPPACEPIVADVVDRSRGCVDRSEARIVGCVPRGLRSVVLDPAVSACYVAREGLLRGRWDGDPGVFLDASARRCEAAERHDVERAASACLP